MTASLFRITNWSRLPDVWWQPNSWTQRYHHEFFHRLWGCDDLFGPLAPDDYKSWMAWYEDEAKRLRFPDERTAEIYHRYWLTNERAGDITAEPNRASILAGPQHIYPCSFCDEIVYAVSRSDRDNLLKQLRTSLAFGRLWEQHDVALRRDACRTCRRQAEEDKAKARQAHFDKLTKRVPVQQEPEPEPIRRTVHTLRTMPYEEYLLTPEWRERARAAKQRAGYRCQLCNRKRELHAHHRTYERRGQERDDDLTVLCAECHDDFHAKHQRKAL